MYLIVIIFLPALFIASFESEGPENHMEKDSWKTLRYEASWWVFLQTHRGM